MLLRVVILALCVSAIAVAVGAQRTPRRDDGSASANLAARFHEMVAGYPASHGIAGVVALIATAALLVAVRAPARRPTIRRR